jgi:NDP-sugar pyrophosphorylase family protein
VTSAPSALVLAAGLGTRLWPLTCVRAKAAAPVAGRALVARVLDRLAAHGCTNVVVNLHHLPATITRIVGDGAEWGLRVRYSWEARILDRAGGARHALPLIDSDPFLILNADTLTNAPLDQLLSAHAATGAIVTLALVPNTAPDRYGGVLLGSGNEVVGFTRKGDTRPSWHFIGVQVANRRAFEALPDGEPVDSIGGVYDDLMAAAPGSVRGFRCDASFHDIGTVREYAETSFTLRAAEAASATTRGVAETFLAGARTRIAASARLHRTILWDDVTVGDGCALEDCVVTDGLAIPAGTRLSRCAVVPAAACPDADGRGAVRLGELAIVPVPDSRASVRG